MKPDSAPPPFVSTPSWSVFSRVISGATTRAGGMSHPPWESLNLGLHTGDDPAAVEENRSRLARAVGVARNRLVFCGQVHGHRIAAADPSHAGTTIERTDGLVTRAVGVALVILVADCAVVTLYDPTAHATAIVHAGWRGTTAGIGERAVRALCKIGGGGPRGLYATIGPSIGPCCYAVGREVIDAFSSAYPEISNEVFEQPDFASAGSFAGTVNTDGAMFDLWKANARILEHAGIPEENIHCVAECTACNTDRYFSHRGENGRTGRFAGVVVLQPR